jgi:hypothetical protein
MHLAIDDDYLLARRPHYIRQIEPALPEFRQQPLPTVQAKVTRAFFCTVNGTWRIVEPGETVTVSEPDYQDLRARALVK